MRLQMIVKVKCYSGHRGEETPRAIQLAGRTVQVKKVLDRWLAPDHRYFKVLGDDDATYIIRHTTVNWTWELVLYRDKDSPSFPATGSEKLYPGMHSS